MSMLSPVVRGFCSSRLSLPLQLARKLPPDRNADHHPDSGLLGEERAKLRNALLGTLERRDPGECLLTGSVEPAAFREDAREHLLELGRGSRDPLLGFSEAARLEQLLDRGAHVVVRIRHAAIIGR